MSNQKFAVGIAGATGLVGREMLKVLEDRKFPVSKLRLFASENSAGEILEFNGKDVKVEVLNEKSFSNANLDLQ